MSNSVWSMVLLCLMMVAVILELLTPSMGGFSLLAAAAAGGSMWMAFRDSDSFGYMMVAVNLVTFPLTLWWGLRFLKHSPLMLKTDLKSADQRALADGKRSHLLGKKGRAVTTLRPAGAVLIEDERIDVVAEGRFVEVDTLVRVIQVDGHRVVVEPVDTNGEK